MADYDYLRVTDFAQGQPRKKSIEGQRLRDLVHGTYDEKLSDAEFRQAVKLMLEFLL